MAIIISKKANDSSDIQEKIEAWHKQHSAERKIRKQKMVADTFGKITFDESKTPEEIQKELRNEWK